MLALSLNAAGLQQKLACNFCRCYGDTEHELCCKQSQQLLRTSCQSADTSTASQSAVQLVLRNTCGVHDSRKGLAAVA